MIYPEVPSVKQHTIYVGDKTMFTPEAIVMQKLMKGQGATSADEGILIQAISFYRKLYPFLKSIDLSGLTEADAATLLMYTVNAVGVIMNPTNDIWFEQLFRVTIVDNNMLNLGKVRDVKYLMQRPIELVRQQGYFGRANTIKTTAFYCSFLPSVAIFETRPKVGDRIILTRWYNDERKRFISCPIAYNKDINNKSTKAAIDGYEKIKIGKHPLLNEIMDLYTQFFGSELIKCTEIKSPMRFEYLYSALFGDQILGNKHDNYYGLGTRATECLIYPSVAFNHREENLAIAPEYMSKLRPIDCTDGIVCKTMYNNTNLANNELPIIFGRIRIANKFNGDKIIWSDD